ncbi:hypothetical protein LCGC14_0911060 [marine sediment metagenome]|uniref:Uncharacterized protein n=1 Tax=marine sediment metagenome TaxID=412755 RepID=A0A0F9NTR5_9ZZZZ|nr:hypothetical protein [Candidatus Aminicenantes bacterium]
MKRGDRVIVPGYQSWKDDGTPYTVTDEKHLKGHIGKLMAIHTGPDDIPLPGTDYHAWVVLDEPIGIQDVIQCQASRLVKLEK